MPRRPQGFFLIVALAAAFVAPVLQARVQQSAAPAFEVASIRSVQDNPGKSFYRFLPSGAVELINVSVRQVIFRAYEIDFMLQRFALATTSREVDRVLDARFDIRARAPEGTTREQQLLMLRTLLAERFNLRIRAESRPTPIYALTLAREGRLGADIRRTTADCEEFRAARKQNLDVEEPRDVYGARICTQLEEFNTPKRGAFILRDAGPFTLFVERLKGFVDRPLVDDTGLTGSFDWVVAFSNDPLETDLPSVAQALEDRLGFRLERRTAPMEVLVIDSVSLPMPD